MLGLERCVPLCGGSSWAPIRAQNFSPPLFGRAIRRAGSAALSHTRLARWLWIAGERTHLLIQLSRNEIRQHAHYGSKAIRANYLTCFDVDGALVRFYYRHGFQEVARAKWDSAHAPHDWCYQTFGTPDFVEMSL